MADTCSGIYFWSGVPPVAPSPLRALACPRTSPGTRSFSPIEFNGYPRRLIYWMRSFAPPARNNCNLQRHWTVAHRCRPSFDTLALLLSMGTTTLLLPELQQRLRARKFVSRAHRCTAGFPWTGVGGREENEDRSVDLVERFRWFANMLTLKNRWPEFWLALR